MSRIEELRHYAELSEWLRELSAPAPSASDSKEAYVKQMHENYNRMRDLNVTSTGILDKYVLPLLAEGDALSAPLTEEEASDLFDFCDMLFDAERMESVDDMLRYKVARRLVRDADEKGDVGMQIRALDILVECCYFLMMAAARLYPESDRVEEFRREGTDAAMRLRGFLEKDKFAALPDVRAKETVLTNARYVASMFECIHEPWSFEDNERHLELLREALSLSDDAFYIEQASKYDWKRHRYRTLLSIANLTEYHNAAGLDEEQLREVNACTGQLLALWKEDPDLYGAFSSTPIMNIALFRNAYLAGEMPLEEYRSQLLAITEDADEYDYTHDGNMRIVFVPTEWMLTLDTDDLTEEQMRQMKVFFDRIVRYVSHMPKLGSLTVLISFLTNALDAFVECDNGLQFETLCAQLLAAINPPTWWHCLMSEQLASCITSHLFEREPLLFKEVPGYPDKEAVCAFVGKAGRLHDAGKIFIAEAVTNYAREYFPDEEDWLMIFTSVGARFLARFSDTRPFATAAATHRFENWQHDIVTQIVTYAERLGWKTNKEEDDGPARIPFINALCREEKVAGELDRIVSSDRDPMMGRVYEMLI